MNNKEIRRELAELLNPVRDIKSKVDSLFHEISTQLHELQINPEKKEIPLMDLIPFNPNPKYYEVYKTFNSYDWSGYETNKKYTTVVELSSSEKIGTCSATYAPLQTCPTTCRFKDKGCYAQLGHCRFTVNRITSAAEKATLRDIAKEEAYKISQLSGTYPLRLHISGDCRTPDAALILSEAAEDYTYKHGKPVWTYTHSWKLIPRKNWGKISVIASCETIQEVNEAEARGYATCLVRYKPFKHGIYHKGYFLRACKEQTEGTKCSECKICMNDEFLKERKGVICFFPHGAKTNQVTNILKSL